MTAIEFTALFPFCGLGAGARGFLDAQVHLLGRDVRFVSLGGIDVDPEACRDFELLTGSPALCADIHELTAERLRDVWPQAPDVTFSSPPCKGFSALMNRKTAESPKYQRMNRLVLKWLELVLEAWPAAPPRLVLIENVPQIATRGRPLLREVKRLLRAAGYVFHAGFHDCGEIGGLAQVRRRYLLVARHAVSVPPLLYQPPKKRVRAVGEVLGPLWMPNDAAGGPMHVMPKISWLNWVRLALIPAGGDWRDLPGVLDGQPRREVFRRHHVGRWDEPSATVAGSGSNGPSAVADPRPWFRGCLGVKRWHEPSGTVTGGSWPMNGGFSVADPRVALDSDNPNRHWSKYRIVPWSKPAGAVCGATRPGSGSPNVADPRIKRAFDHAYAVIRWYDEPSPTVAAGSHPGQGAYAVGDPRLRCAPRAGAYGVIPWQEAAKTVTGSACIDNGTWAVQDPRIPDQPVMLLGDVRRPPAAVPLIVSEDDTWHRPLTTLELGVLQGLPPVLDGKPLLLSGSRVSAWRERIGNAVPTPAARAIAEQMLVTLTHGALNSFALSGSNDVWVRHEDGDLAGWYLPAH